MYSYTASIEKKFNDINTFKASFIKQLLEELKWNRARDVHFDNNQITFRAGLFRLTTGLNPLKFISKGIIKVEAEKDNLKIIYRIFFKQWLIVSILISLFFFPIFLQSAYDEPILFVIYPFLWLCIYYIPFLFSVFAFGRIVNNLLNELKIQTT